jgi:predicted unusual protein kinase regulating ubiquinone biosynthesis (AarF/ABC1/UbiB family)
VKSVTEPAATQRRASIPAQETVPAFRPRERFFRVSLFFFQVVAHIFFWDVFLARFGLLRWYVQRTNLKRWVMIARRFRRLAVKLGGIHIKLGQFLSARADIIPEAVRRELAGLQDEVPPAPAGHVLEHIIADLGAPPDELFLRFEPEAVAAASLGQVHFATLHDGREAAVKVQRPHIEEIVEVDLSALSWIVRLIKDYRPIRRRADLNALFEEFARVLKQELDYVQEARHAELFRANFAAIPGVYVPEPYIEMTTRHVLVMERISGYKISDLETLDELGVSRHELAERLNHTYLKQFFVDGFFHADPHPGNLFVRIEPDQPIDSYTNGKAPPGKKDDYSSSRMWAQLESEVEHEIHEGTPFTLIFIDFGMVGHLPARTMEILRNGVIGLATNDAERIVESMERARMLLPGIDKRPVIQAVQVMLRYSYDRTIQELTNMDVETIFDETRDLVYDLPFQIPQDLLYLGRAMSMVSGLATAIEPDINLFNSLRPFAHMIMERERRNGDWLSFVQTELRDLGQVILTLPRQMDAYYKAANRGELQTRTDFGRLERGMRRVEHSTDRLTGGLLATAFFLGGVQLRTRGLEKEARRAWWATGLMLGWLFLKRNREDRR